MSKQGTLFQEAQEHARVVLDVDAYAKDHDDVIDYVESGFEFGHTLQFIRAHEGGWRLRFRRVILDSIERRRVAADTAMGLFGGGMRTRFSEIKN